MHKTQCYSEWHQFVFACFTQLEGTDTGDFEAINAAAFLHSTESSKTIFIAVKDDDLPEADETFTFNLALQVSPQVHFEIGLTFADLQLFTKCFWIYDKCLLLLLPCFWGYQLPLHKKSLCSNSAPDRLKP